MRCGERGVDGEGDKERREGYYPSTHTAQNYTLAKLISTAPSQRKMDSLVLRATPPIWISASSSKLQDLVFARDSSGDQYNQYIVPISNHISTREPTEQSRAGRRSHKRIRLPSKFNHARLVPEDGSTGDCGRWINGLGVSIASTGKELVDLCCLSHLKHKLKNDRSIYKKIYTNEKYSQP